MTQWVVDTNVMVVANGRHSGHRAVSANCRAASIKFLIELLEGGNSVLVDLAGEVLSEYRSYLNPSGQPGVGDRFLLEIYRNVDRVQRVDLVVGEDGDYVDLHPDIKASVFDRSDRKFAALALVRGAPVANSVDSDWVEQFCLLTACGVDVHLLCGAQQSTWYDD